MGNMFEINQRLEANMVRSARQKMQDAMENDTENGLMHSMHIKNMFDKIKEHLMDESTKPPFRIHTLQSAYTIASSLLCVCNNGNTTLRDFLHDRETGLMYTLGWEIELSDTEYNKIKDSLYKDFYKLHFRIMHYIKNFMSTKNLNINEVFESEICDSMVVTKSTKTVLSHLQTLVVLTDDEYTSQFSKLLGKYINVLAKVLDRNGGKMQLYPITLRGNPDNLPSLKTMEEILFLMYDHLHMDKYNLEDDIIKDIWFTTYLSKVIQSSRVVELTENDSDSGLPIIKISDDVMADMDRYMGERSISHPKSLPMVVEPDPWGRNAEGKLVGGFKTIDAPLVPTLKSHQLEPNDRYISNLNRIQKTGYRINKKLRKFAEDVGYLHTPDSNKGFDHKMHVKKPNGWTKVRWERDVESKNAKNRDMRKIVEIADEYLDYKNIYFTNYSDFRGRIYYRQEYLSPQGQDLSKALLEFDVGLKINNPTDLQAQKNALHWMRVNVANLAGQDSGQLKYRALWTKRNEKKIRDLLDNPLKTKTVRGKTVYPNMDFMMSADKPWQFIAACIDYIDYLDDPDNHKSYMPVGLDGCCNGTQHWCAMLRDYIGGVKVAIAKTDKPADLYTEVLNALLKILEGYDDPEDAKLALEWIATGKIQRKLVKTPTMTTTYAAGKKAFRKQVMSYCIDKGISFGDTMEEIKPYINFMVEMIIKSIDDVVQVKSGMDFVQKVVKGRDSVYFKTPFMGFHVYMENTLSYKRTFNVKMDNRLKKVTFMYDSGKPDCQGIETGIAPNFVHSMDATHMLMTVERAGDGITHWMMIHDQFSTHAAKTELMRNEIRNSFAELYREDQLKRFRDMMDSNETLPEYGDWEPDMVKSSNYFFC